MMEQGSDREALLTQEDIDRLFERNKVEPAPVIPGEDEHGGEPAGTQASGDSGFTRAGELSQEEIDRLFAQTLGTSSTREVEPEPAVRTQVRPVMLQSFDQSPAPPPRVERANFDLIQDVPLEISVEVGRAKKLVREIIDFSEGTIVELDKQAGDPVDVIVNGQMIARGEIVVIDENFGVRITEIIKK